MKSLDYIGYFLLLVSITLIIIGISTYAWPAVDGQIVNQETIYSIIDQSAPGASHKGIKVKDTPAFRERITYTYAIEGHVFSSNNVILLGSELTRVIILNHSRMVNV